MAYGMNRSSSKFTPLSDEDEDDFANFSIGNESPAHARNDSDGDQTGHLYASHQSTAGAFSGLTTEPMLTLPDSSNSASYVPSLI